MFWNSGINIAAAAVAVGAAYFGYTLLTKEKKPLSPYDDGECPVCLEEPTNKSLLPCGHVYCFECLKLVCQTKCVCPMCRRIFYTFKHNIRSKSDYEVGIPDYTFGRNNFRKDIIVTHIYANKHFRPHEISIEQQKALVEHRIMIW
jgi:hypothetical protein